jgi:hypothetical protein
MSTEKEARLGENSARNSNPTVQPGETQTLMLQCTGLKGGK